MDRLIARLNIEHFEHLLKSTTELAEREKIEKLLAEEKAKLALIDAQSGKKQSQR
jgi:hypothetical protein